MPLHLNDLDLTSEIEGLRSALIVPCYMCPAVTVAVRKEEPYIQLFKSFIKSAPFEEYIRDLQSTLKETGVKTEVFKSRLPHQWFLCMWTAGRRKKLRKSAEPHDAVIVLGCDTATETMRGSVSSKNCRIIEGMKVAGFMNAKLKLRLPLNVTFEDCKIIPITR